MTVMNMWRNPSGGTPRAKGLGTMDSTTRQSRRGMKSPPKSAEMELPTATTVMGRPACSVRTTRWTKRQSTAESACRKMRLRGEVAHDASKCGYA